MTAPGPTHLDSARGWVTASGSALSVMAAFGTIYSFNAFAKSMAEEFGTGHGPISLVFGITVFLFFGSAVISGRLYDRFGIAPLLIVGGTMSCGGLFAMSQVSVLWHGYVLFGVGLGFGGGLFNAPLFALTAMWFARHRAVAQGLVATGSGLGTMLFAPLAQWLLEIHGWRGGMKILTVIAAGIFATALLMIKRPPKMEMGDAKRHLSLVVRSAPFWQMAAAGVFFTVAVIGSLGSVVTFAQDDGLPARAAVALFTIIGFSSIVGRMALTSLARPLGSVRLLKIAFFGLPVAYALWLVTTRVGGLEANFVLLIIFASILGVSYGGFVALLGDVTAHLFGLAGLGAVMGMLFFSSGTGALIGPPLMGFTADATGGIGLPILISGVISAVGVVVLLPMTRHPVPLPTYVGPPGAQPLPVPAPLEAAPPRPLVPQPSAAGGSNGELAPRMIRPAADALAAAQSLPRATALRDAPPEVFWPVADETISPNGQS
ncbi:MAG: MFS transporter [Acidimicrobiales bacterium]|nr:MFS transporter [Acidimicrobiales bacterium]MYD33987.1 MFS transporter [Acidimicrobiales bacterium]MYI09564.1 MFS transporter [Acidimicrobiales bacterium]